MQTASKTLLAAVAAVLVAAPVHAQQTVTLPKKDTPLAGTPTAVFSVGAEEGESWEMLSNVQAVRFDGRDNLYVLDSGNFRVLVFDRAGKFVRQIGKQGNGPGELTFPLGLAIAPDGKIVVADMGRGGFAIFNPDGSYVTNVASPEGMRVSGGNNFFVDATGSVIVRSMPTITRGPGDGGPPAGPMLSPIVRHALTANATPATIFQIEMPAPRVQESNAGGRQMRMVMFSPPTFAANPSFAALPNGGIAVSVDSDYAVKIVDPSGKVQRVVQREEKPRRVTRRDQDAARENLRKQLSSPSGQGGMRVTNNDGRMSFGFGGGGNMTKEQIEERVRDMTFADVMPMVQAVRTDPMGRIWVQRSPEQVGGNGVIDLLAGDGRYLGSIHDQKLPDAVSSTGLAAYIERDDLDVQQIAVRRMPASWMVGVAGAGRVGDN